MRSVMTGGDRAGGAGVLLVGGFAGRGGVDARARLRTRPGPPPQPAVEFEIYGFAMLDMGHNFTQIHPDWFDTLRLTKLPSSEKQFGEDNSTFAGVRQSRLGVKSSRLDVDRRPEDHLRVRTVRHRRRRGTDDVPPAPRVGRAGRVRRGPVLEPVHRSGRLPELARVLGTDRPGLVPQRPGPMDAGAATSTRPSWSRSSGRVPAATRASTPTASSCRTSRPASRCRTSRPPTSTPRSGATRASRASCAAIKWDDMLDDKFDLSGSATGWGINFDARTSSSARSDVLRVAFVVRRRHPELDERLAGRHRHREESRERRDTDRGQAAADERR